MGKDNRTEKLRQIRDEVIACKKCPLYKERILPVVGEGSHWAKAMFIGEAPGASEARAGRPFCGAAGEVLSELLQSIGCKREDVYITNILKDRPPNNRDPQKNEIEACTPYLERQINIIQPKIVCAMGNYATGFILEKFGLGDKIQGISKIRGRLFEAKTEWGSFKIVPLYHPAVAVYNVSMKKVLMDDFEHLKDLIC